MPAMYGDIDRMLNYTQGPQPLKASNSGAIPLLNPSVHATNDSSSQMLKSATPRLFFYQLPSSKQKSRAKTPWPKVPTIKLTSVRPSYWPRVSH